jgi:hypothetical protein
VLVGAVFAAGGCEGRETRTVGEVKRSFAEAAVAGDAPAGGLGTIAASSHRDRWSRLLDVEVRLGDAFWLRADSADLIVDADADTMRVRFNGVLWVAPENTGGEGPGVLESIGAESLRDGAGETAAGDAAASGDGRLRSAPVRTTEPWPLGVDVVLGGVDEARGEPAGGAGSAGGGAGAEPGPVRLDGG